MLKKISLMRSRSSVISGNLPARRRLGLFENRPQRDVMLAREAFAVLVLRRQGYHIATARDLHAHSAPSRVHLIDFACELEAGDRMVPQSDGRSFGEEDRRDPLPCRGVGGEGA